jgi:tetratricopeptide (TPR) repeat protein
MPPDHAPAAPRLNRLQRSNAGRRNRIKAVPLPSSIASLFAEAVRRQQCGHLAAALALYDEILSRKDDLAEVHCNRGVALARLGRFSDAEKAYRQAIGISPEFADAYNNLGNALCEQKEQDRLIEAEAAYRRAVELNPKLANAYSNLSATLKELGRLADAHRAAEEAVRLEPRTAWHLLNLSEIRQFCADDPFVAAMEQLAQNIASLPVKQQIELHFALAKAYDDLERRDDSLQHLLAGNALKRRQIRYDEATTLAAFERIQATFTSDLIHNLRGNGDQSSVPIFIVGMVRSGTTLIEQILASHPRVFGAGELPHLDKAVASLRPAAGCMSPFPELMRNTSREQLAHLGAHYIAEMIKLAPTATHVTDKTPWNFLFAGLIHLALPNARIIHAVRDPFDTCMSCFSKLFAAGQYHTYDLAELGRYYRRYRALMEHWHRVLPRGRILDVRYEDVVADLEGQARRIIAHCGLAWDTRCLAFHETERPVRTASAAQVRRPIYKTSIGRWRGLKQFLRPLLAELSSGPESKQIK